MLAFSRDGPKKVYVQHRLKEYAKEVNALLEKKAYFYVCGDAANMAREVNTVLAQILSTERNIPETKAEEMVKQMRASNQYQVRPQPCLFCFVFFDLEPLLIPPPGGCVVVNKQAIGGKARRQWRWVNSHFLFSFWHPGALG